MAVRVTGPGGVVPHHGCLDLGHGHLDLAALGSDPGGGVLGDPADDLLGRPGLRGVQRVGDLGMQRGRERPGLGSVHHDLDEPQRLRIGPKSALSDTGRDVVSGDPLLVGLAGETPGRGHPGQWRGGVAVGDTAALGQVVVIGTGAVLLDVGTGSTG